MALTFRILFLFRLPPVQVMDIAMRYHFMNSCISIGRSLYDATRPHVVPIDGVCEIWKGHFQVILHSRFSLALGIYRPLHSAQCLS